MALDVLDVVLDLFHLLSVWKNGEADGSRRSSIRRLALLLGLAIVPIGGVVGVVWSPVAGATLVLVGLLLAVLGW